MSTYLQQRIDGDEAWGPDYRTLVASMPGLDLGAGGTADDTAAVQDVLDRIAAFGGGVAIARPNTTYTIQGVNHPNRVLIAGHGPGSLFQMKAGTTDNVYAFSATGSSTDTTGNVLDIGMFNCRVRGTVTTDGFVQHRHLVTLGGVSGYRTRDVRFEGFQGDAIYVGHPNGNERHNERIHIGPGTVFDGLNQDNRNAISFIDATDYSVIGAEFYNCTRAGQVDNNMPGPIDLEPNAGFTWARLVNGVIAFNRFRNCRANTGLITVALQVTQANLTTPMVNLLIAHNNMSDNPAANASFYLSQAQTPTATTRRNNIRVEGNTAYLSGRPYEVNGVRGVVMDGNQFDSPWNPATVGYGNLVRDLDVYGETHENVGGSSGYEIYRVIDASLDGMNMTRAGSTQVLRFLADTGAGASTGSSDRIDVTGMKIRGSGPTAVLLKDAGHTITASGAANTARGNRWNGLSTAALTSVFAAGNTSDNLA